MSVIQNVHSREIDKLGAGKKNMCNGHKFVKTSLFQYPGYLVDLSPYVSAVISSRFISTPIQYTANALKPIARSLLPTKLSSYVLNTTLTCEMCLHQVDQDSFDDGRQCPSLLLQQLESTLEQHDFIHANSLLEYQEKVLTERKAIVSNAGSQSFNSYSSDIDSCDAGTSQESSIISNEFNINKFKDILLVTDICPEVGLHAQKFKCIECDTKIDLNSAKLCHYDGRYYCYSCHTNSYTSPIPVRIFKNWDFTLKPVSKTSWHKICYLRTRPVLFDLFQLNPLLYGLIDKLVEIKQLRIAISIMLNYINVCGQPEKPTLTDVPKHFLNEELINLFSLNDLYDIDRVYQSLSQLQANLDIHITKRCESCRGKGFYCELCRDSRDVLYPFFKNATSCTKCLTVYHKNCFQRKKRNCPKCLRLAKKRSNSISITTESY